MGFMLDTYVKAYTEVRPDLIEWLRTYDPADYGSVVEFADIQARIADVIREDIDAKGILSASQREQVVLDTLKRFRQTAMLVNTPASHDAIMREMDKTMGVAASRANTAVVDTQMDTERAEILMDFRFSGSETWKWKSKLDTKTCLWCLARHGRSFPSVMPMKSHPNCRCIPVHPDIDLSNGMDWLMRRSDKTLRRMLGPSRYRMVKSGTISPENLVNERGVTPLRDLRAMGDARYDPNLLPEQDTLTIMDLGGGRQRVTAYRGYFPDGSQSFAGVHAGDLSAARNRVEYIRPSQHRGMPGGEIFEVITVEGRFMGADDPVDERTYEVFAILHGLKDLPPGWDGIIYVNQVEGGISIWIADPARIVTRVMLPRRS